MPKATEKKAVCGANQAFNSVSRSCVDVSEARTRPIGTKSSESLSQEEAKTIILSYSDANGNSAISCKIAADSISSNIEVMSPQVVNRGIFTQANVVFSTGQSLALALPTQATTELAEMADALNLAQKSFNYSNIISQLGVFRTKAGEILGLAAPNVSDPTVKFYYDLLVTRLATFDTMKTFVDKRCDCSGGACTTVIAPRQHKSGAAGFSYTISDIDGEGDPKAVSLSIAAMSVNTDFLRPVAASEYFIDDESDTSLQKTYAITLPGASDYIPTPTFTYKFVGDRDLITNKGTTASGGLVSGCMDLPGSTGPADILCDYTPKTADKYDVTTPTKASVTINGLKFTANKVGSFANDITIQYFDLQNIDAANGLYVTSTESFGLISQTYGEAFVRVVGDSIKVFINPTVTSNADIQNLINSDAAAKILVTVTDGSLLVFPTPSVHTPVAIKLDGSNGGTLGVAGSDAYDKFSYKVNNGHSDSINSSNVIIKINPIDDKPTTPLEYNGIHNPLTSPNASATTVDQAEGATGQEITLPYNDVDLAGNPNCSADFTTGALQLTNILTPCTCAANVCKVNVMPAQADFTGTGHFYYKVTTLDQFAPFLPKESAFEKVSVYFWEVNDAPTITLDSINPSPVLENSDAAPASPYVCFTATPGGGTDEANQQLTFNPSQIAPTSNPNLIVTFGTRKDPDVAGNTCAAGQYMLPFTTQKNQSGTSTIRIAVTDNGTTKTLADPKTTNLDFLLTVDFVDDPPAFNEFPTLVDTNEGGLIQTTGFEVDEDTGNSTDENDQGIMVTSVVSDNEAVLPNSAISFFYDINDNEVEDSNEIRSAATFLESGDAFLANASSDVALHKLYFKLKPIDGVSGNANITVTISDGNRTASKTFALIAHPIAAIHGGWKNISAVGIKTDKNGAPVSSSDIQCNFNTNKCNGSQTCTGAGSPHASVIPSAANVIYKDSTNNKCYRSTSASQFSWIEFKTTCPIKPVLGFCSDENCIVSATPSATAAGQYYYDTDDNKCYVSSATGSWTEFVPSKITLSWNTFSVSGSGAYSSVQNAGWRVYRRESGKDYDYEKGYLDADGDKLTISNPLITTYTDTTAVAGNVYYYLVRPVDNTVRKLSISTPEVFSEVRVFAPKENYAFVHRWMVNQEVCNSMHMTTATANKVDPTHNYRCPYEGPGDNNGCSYTVAPVCDDDAAGPNPAISCTGTANPDGDISSPKDTIFYNSSNKTCWKNTSVGSGDDWTEIVNPPHYYDIGKDMLVDISESGCPYSPAPNCTPNGCIGIGSPTTLGIIEDANSVYYDRNAGSCYISAGGGNWKSYAEATDVQIAAASQLANTALNPPLVNIPQSQADLVCSNRSTTTAVGLLQSMGASYAKLPTKKEYIAYAAAPIGVSDALLTTMEEGDSINIQSRCNSNNASGLESSYTDSSIPSTSYIYSIPGTSSSGIRSLYTGSIPWGINTSTEACTSRYGIQDVYGNVAEWVKDKMTCAGQSPGPVSTTLTEEPYVSLSVPLGLNNVHDTPESVKLLTFTDTTATVTATAGIGVTSIEVDDTTGFGSSGFVVIDDELITFTSTDADTLNVNTTLDTHAIGATVTLVTSSTEVNVWDTVTAGAGTKKVPISTAVGLPGSGTVAIDREVVAYTAIEGSGELTVASTTGFPSSGSVKIGTETVTYTAKTATKLTLGTNTNIAHADGDVVSLVVEDENYVCTTDSGTDLGDYAFVPGGPKYAFDFVTGPYNDANASSTVDATDSFLTGWSFRDELFSAGKFSFPLGMPINTDIASADDGVLEDSDALAFLLDIGPTSGITTTQLHEDGIIVDSAAVSNLFDQADVSNPNGYVKNPTQKGSFAQGGNFTSGHLSGRYSSELVPDAEERATVGFRCYIPVDTVNYPSDAGFHTYSY